VSLLASPLWVARYLLVILAPLALLAAVGAVGQLRVPHWQLTARILAISAVLAFAVIPRQHALRGATAKSGADYRGLASIIRDAQQPGDGIVYRAGSRALVAGIDYYLRRDPGRPRDLLTQRSAADAASLLPVEFADPVAHVAGTARVWLLVPGDRADPAASRPDLRGPLTDDFRQIGVWHRKWATLALFRRTPGAVPHPVPRTSR
jgi:mannosyltransferase